jgi:parallel beta helix pectate lyase-like protein
MRILWSTLRVCVGVLIAMPAFGSTIVVPADGNLQQAINNAEPGDVIALPPGAIYTGSFVLPVKSGDAPITIRTGTDFNLPGAGGRISPADAPNLAVVRQGSAAPAIRTAPGAHHWLLMLLEIQGNGNSDIIALGDGSSTGQVAEAQIPHHLMLDRVYVHGDATRGQKRGVALNSATTWIIGSWISDIKAVGQDSQAICGWNGPGPFVITNNWLQAAGENLMFGGSDPAVPNLVPSDITIADNQFIKDTAWRTEKWTVKNLLELKNARRVQILRNVFDYNWQAGQSGYAIVFTVRNQYGRCTWCTVESVLFEQNAVRHTAAGIEILGSDNNHPSQQSHAIVIHNNLFTDIDNQRWGGNGYFLLLTAGPRDITIDHNTIISDHGSGIVVMDGSPVLEFRFTNNLVRHNTYGFKGTGRATGMDSINAFLPGSDITRNVMAGGDATRYPAGNGFPTVPQFESQFTSYAGGDYRLLPASPWRGVATDGLDLGAIY